MIRWGYYARCALKRSFKLLPVIAITALLFISAIGAAFFVMVSGNNELKLRVRVGLVGDTDAEYLGIGVLALEKFDSSRMAIEFIEYDSEDDAAQALKAEKISAYVYIPDEFIDSVLVGDNDPMTLVSADRTDNLVPAMIREMAGDISIYITDSQRSIYAMRRCVREYDLEEVELRQTTDDLNLRYISLVTERGSWCDVIETGEMGTSSYGGYYICSFLFLLLMLFSVMATPLFAGGREKCAYFRSYGVGAVKQIGAELFAYAVLVLVPVFVLCLAVGIFLPGGVVNEFNGSVTNMMGFFLRILPSALLIMTLSVFMWELVPDTVNGVLLQFIITVGIGYISGCFYPSSMFPQSVQAFAAVLPTGVALSGLRGALSDEMTLNSIVIMVAMIAAFFLAACAVRHYRLRKGGKE